MYVLPYNSKADLLTLRAQCLAHVSRIRWSAGVDAVRCCRYVFIHGGPRVFAYYAKEESVKLFAIISIAIRVIRLLDVQMVARFRDVWPRAGSWGENNPHTYAGEIVQKFFCHLGWVR